MVLKKTLESPLDSKDIKPVKPKGNQLWIFIGRTDAEAKAPILFIWCEESTHWKRFWLWERRKVWRKEEKKMTEDEMVGWHHHLKGHEFEQTLGDGYGQGNLTWCSPWGCKESDTTERLNNSNKAPMRHRWWDMKGRVSIHALSAHTSLAASHLCILERCLPGVRCREDKVLTWRAVTWLPLPSQWDPIAITSTKPYWVSLYAGCHPWHLNVFTEGGSLPHSCTLSLTSKTLFLKPHFNLPLRSVS